MGLLYDTLGNFVAMAMWGLALLFAWAMRPWWRRAYVQAWMASFGSMGLGLALFAIPASDRTTPGMLLLAARNGCLLLGLGYQAWGWARILGRNWPWPVAWTPTLALVPAYLLWGRSYPHRVMIVDLAMALIALVHLWILRRTIPPALARLGAMIRALVLGHALFCVLRAAMAFGAFGQESLFQWTAYAFLEFFAVFAVLACLEWVWVDQWEEENATDPGHSS